jgi:hypothetical protein
MLSNEPDSTITLPMLEGNWGHRGLSDPWALGRFFQKASSFDNIISYKDVIWLWFYYFLNVMEELPLRVGATEKIS